MADTGERAPAPSTRTYEGDAPLGADTGERAPAVSSRTYEGDVPRGAGMDMSVSKYGGLSGGRYGDGWASLVDALSTNKIKQLPQQPTHQKNGECCDGEKMRNPSGSRMDPCTSGGVSLLHGDGE